MPARRPVSRGTSRKLVWARTSVSLQPLGGTAASVDLLTSFRSLGGSTLGATVTRVRGSFSFTTGGVTPANSAIVGMLVETSTSTDVPDPFVDVGADWLQWEHLPVAPINGSNGTNTPAVDPVYGWAVDVRSQRKMEELQQTLFLSVHNLGPGGDQIILAGYVSVLLRLP